MRDFSAFDLRRAIGSYSAVCESVDVEGSASGGDMDFGSEDFIRSAFDPPQGDVTRTRKIPPNVEFMRTAYPIFNAEFFGNELPEHLHMDVNTDTTSTALGVAGYRFDALAGTVVPVHIVLNARYVMTLHEWLNLLLHECIHVYEYVKNPYAFLRGRDRRGVSHYDAHGPWFMSVARRFGGMGFNVEKYCREGTFDMNVGDRTVAKSVSRNGDGMLLARMVGVSDDHGGGVVKISRTFRPKFEEFIEGCIARKRDFCKTLEKVEYYTSDNPKVSTLKRTSPRDASSGISWYFFDSVERNYGPLELESEFVPKTHGMEGVPKVVALMVAKPSYREYVAGRLVKAAMTLATESPEVRDLVDYFLSADEEWREAFSEDWLSSVAEDSGLDRAGDLIEKSFEDATNGFRSVSIKTVDWGAYGAESVVMSKFPGLLGEARFLVDAEIDRVVKKYEDGFERVDEDFDETDIDDRNLIDDRYARGGWIPFRNTRTKMTSPMSGIVDVA